MAFLSLYLIIGLAIVAALGLIWVRQFEPFVPLKSSEIADLVPLFHSMEKVNRQELLKLIVSQVRPAGEVIFQEGTLGDSLYILVSGKVRFFHEVNGRKLTLGMLKEGDFFGEMGLLSGGMRTAGAEAVTASQIVRLDREAVLEFANREPAFLEKIWLGFAWRIFVQKVRDVPELSSMKLRTCKHWFAQHFVTILAAGATVPVPKGADYVFLVVGEVSDKEGTQKGPKVLPVNAGQSMRAVHDARLLWLPEPPKGRYR